MPQLDIDPRCASCGHTSGVHGGPTMHCYGDQIEPCAFKCARYVQSLRQVHSVHREERQVKKYIIEFDYRSDLGPYRVGPFDTRQHAETWLDENITKKGVESESSTAPLHAPNHKP